MTRNILLVTDDSLLDLAIPNEIFKHLFQVECFEESRPAMSYVRCNSQRIGAVLLDACLGRCRAGLQVPQQLQAALETAAIPVILITADAREEYVLNGLKKGAVDFLAKLVIPQMVQKRVCSAVRAVWPAGTTVLDVGKPGRPPHALDSEPCLPDPPGRWEWLLRIFFQICQRLHSSRYLLLWQVTATLARFMPLCFRRAVWMRKRRPSSDGPLHSEILDCWEHQTASSARDPIRQALARKSTTSIQFWAKHCFHLNDRWPASGRLCRRDSLLTP